MQSHNIDGYQIDVLFSEDQITSRIRNLAHEIAALKPERLLVIPVLKGSFIFAADLIRAMHHADPRFLSRGHTLIRQG
jgi:hypoxanthine phosphoribosyltransferase